MKIVNIIGGLGNQMLQYAFALALQHQHPDEEILIDTSHFGGYGLHNGYEIGRIFGQQLKKAKAWDILRVSWYVPNYKLSRAIRRIIPLRKSEKTEDWRNNYGKYLQNIQSFSHDAYYEGYWHNPQYYKGCESKIREAYRFPEFNDERNLKYADMISTAESICVHIRRGDYVGATSFEGICGEIYYKKAIEKALSSLYHPVMFVFSNDIPYCNDLLSEYSKTLDIYYIDINHGKDSFRDMQLMTLAKCNIICNSTFSWWGAWLNQRDKHIVISPDKWVNFTEETGMIPDEWIKI